jgi:hypothetical protein
MAGPVSPAARAKSLANDFGPTRGPNAPDGFYIILLDDNPEFDGEELDSGTCPGYARTAVDNDDFAVISGVGMRVTANPAAPTGAWTKIARYAALLNAADTSEMWDYTAINPIRVREAGPFENPLSFTVYYSDDSTEPA